MPGIGIGLEARGGAELSRISRELKQVGNGKQLRRAFSKELRAAAAPLVPAVRSAIRSIPAKGPAHTGLRASMARATKLTVRTVGPMASIAILVDGRKMPTWQRALQSYMEGKKSPWRHPAFGDRTVWVVQQPHPYFYTTVRPLGAASRVAVNRVVARTAKKIT